MIRTAGANVAPVEVDDVIARIPGIMRTQTAGVPDDLRGEMVVACNGATLGDDGFMARRKAEIASFEAPRRVLFFTDDDYAITGSEKVKSSQARDLASAGCGPRPPRRRDWALQRPA